MGERERVMVKMRRVKEKKNDRRGGGEERGRRRRKEKGKGRERKKKEGRLRAAGAPLFQKVPGTNAGNHTTTQKKKVKRLRI